jgi:hypothetical protein
MNSYVIINNFILQSNTLHTCVLHVTYSLFTSRRLQQGLLSSRQARRLHNKLCAFNSNRMCTVHKSVPSRTLLCSTVASCFVQPFKPVIILTAEARVRTHVGFVVDLVVLGQIFLRILRYSPVNIIPPLLHIHSYIMWGIDKGLVRGPVPQRNSLTPTQQ